MAVVSRFILDLRVAARTLETALELMISIFLMRGQQARLTRRTRNGSRKAIFLEWSLRLWRNLYNWTRVHASLNGLTPPRALGLAEKIWSVFEYVRSPTHVTDFQHELWQEQRNAARPSPLDVYLRKKRLLIS